MNEHQEKLKVFFRNYSLDDLAKGFFALNLWLPNVASPIKLQYLYVVLESVSSDLTRENKIKSYSDYKVFCTKLIKLIPSFSMIEDYVPETDWGEIKYYFKKKFYKIFYGGDLSNPYDFYYSFEIIHRAFEKNYQDLVERSPLQEFQFCLDVQDYLITNIDQEKSLELNIGPGDISVPSEDFWFGCSKIIDGFAPDKIYDPEIVNTYTQNLDSMPPQLSIDNFEERAYKGKNCQYFFIEKNKKYYPVLPRRYLSVIYETWGKLLKGSYPKILKDADDIKPEEGIGIELYRFMRDRIEEDNIFPFASPLYPDQKPHEMIFSAIRSKDKLFLIYVTPPEMDTEHLTDHIKDLDPKLKECKKLVSTVPTRLGLRASQKTVEFRSKKEDACLEPTFLVIIPSSLFESLTMLSYPENFPAKIIWLDQLTGIIDEINKLDELNDFIDYLDKEKSLSKFSGLNSYLDIFGSFKDSYGVLVQGANEPDFIGLDSNWGSNLRYRSLKGFWETFPKINFYGHPRSWTIPVDRITKTGLILKSKNFLGYAYYQNIGSASFFINAPVNLMRLEQGRIVDLMMLSLFDALEIYSDILGKLDFTKGRNMVQILLAPSSLITQSKKLDHLKPLVQDVAPWSMDVGQYGPGDYGIRVVYNDNKILAILKDATDRSTQINLLIDVLKQLNSVHHEKEQEVIERKLDLEKTKQVRYKFSAVQMGVDFPEAIKTILPEQKDYIIANKEIAQIANVLGIKPGDYISNEAKAILNNLIDHVVGKINIMVARFNLKWSIPLLIEKIDALTNESKLHEARIKISLDHEVDYEREESTSEERERYLHRHNIYRYLLEKFVQIQPCGKEEFTILHLKGILAYIDRLLDIRFASDSIQYEMYPAKINIDHDYIVSLKYNIDIKRMKHEYGKEQAQINLGIIGNKKDIPDSHIPITEYIGDLDLAFKDDFGFTLRNLLGVQQIMSLWASCNKEVPEHTYYCTTTEELKKICLKKFKGFDSSETENILDFITLKPENILKITGDSDLAKDLPTWEHTKRLTRYSIRPLIKIKKKYYWGPHSLEQACNIWANIYTYHRLPAKTDAPKVVKVLKRGHKGLENCLQEKINKIVERFTRDVECGVFPHKYDKEIKDIGDCDILALLKDKNILLNIESKIIDPAYCFKDMGRIQRKLFGNLKDDGSFKKGYLQKVEEREDYLKTKAIDLIMKIKWDVPPTTPTIISIFVTKMSFWWTKFPPVKTDVNFIEIKLLDDFLKSLYTSK